MPGSATKTPKHQPLDDETAAALTLYNTYLIADREQQAHERALRKAEKAKDEAAASVRKLNERKASASEMAEAEAKYRDAVAALRRLRGGHARPQDENEQSIAASEQAEDAADDDTSREQADDTADGEAGTE